MKATHRLSKIKEFTAWTAMKNRCHNKNSEHYADYGGRGITVAAEWVSDFLTFLKHVGPRPSPQHSIDRIDNARGYEPGNVRWAVPLQQMRNTRHNRLITLNGKTQCVSAWCEELGLPQEVIYSRLKKGWNEQEALTTPRLIRPDLSHLRPVACRLIADGKMLAEVAATLRVSPQAVSEWWHKAGGANLNNRRYDKQ